MLSTTHSQDVPQSASGDGKRQDNRMWKRVQLTLWCLALIVFIASCFIVHTHPKPYPLDLTITQTVQHLQLPSFLDAILIFPSILNNPIPSEIALGLWLVVLLVMTLIARLRHRSPLKWLLATIFFIVTVMSSAGLNVLVDDAVGRPRPDPYTEPVHVVGALVSFPTFPSGHTEHDIAYYGFLLYLSLLKPVRAWRYRWVLLPLQIYAVYDILCIGYSRILEGDHWFTDVMGGYLEGLIYLFFFIFLYRECTILLANWQQKRTKGHEGTTQA